MAGTPQAPFLAGSQYTDRQGKDKLAAAFPQVEQSFRDYAEKLKIPGLCFGIVVDGELVYSGAFGLRNVAENAPVKVDSIYRIASMTKSITAMCVVKLRDEGKLRLDNPAADYVPELASLQYPTTDSVPITVRQLLTMSVGFPQDDPWADRQLGLDNAELPGLIAEGISFSNPPGLGFEYSNYGYGILGRIVTNVSGIRYQQYAAQNILQPLGMTSSTYDINAVPADRFAMGYRLEDGKWVEEPPLRDGAFASMGGLFTTIPDFARYMAFLLSAFPPRDDPEQGPVRRSSVREMQRPWEQHTVVSARPRPDVPPVVEGAGYGFGLNCGIDSLIGYSVAHGGGLPGYGSYYRILPYIGVGIVAFGNLTYQAPSQLIREGLALLKKMGGLRPRRPVPSPALTATQAGIADLYAAWDDHKARELATDTFYMDMLLEKRRAQFDQLRSDLGACQSMTDLEPENALRGRWKMVCERGSIDLFATLAPTVPPRLQYLVITVARPMSPALRQAALRLTRLSKSWDDAWFRLLFNAQIDRKQMRAQLESLNVQYGALKIGDTLEGDGETWARVRLVGERGSVDMRFVLAAQSGRINEVAFSRPRETSFMP